MSGVRANKVFRNLPALLGALALVGLASEGAQGHEPAMPASGALSAPGSPNAPPDFPASAPLAESDLDTLRGGQGVTVISTQTLTADSVGNSVNAGEVGSGSVALEGGALSGFNGIANVVVNTGHNNNLQGSVSVSVIYNETPASP